MRQTLGDVDLDAHVVRVDPQDRGRVNRGKHGPRYRGIARSLAPIHRSVNQKTAVLVRTMSSRGAQRRGIPFHAMSSRGAQRRGIPFHAKRSLASLGMTAGMVSPIRRLAVVFWHEM